MMVSYGGGGEAIVFLLLSCYRRYHQLGAKDGERDKINMNASLPSS